MTNEEIIIKWESGEIIESCILGGLSESYEQAIQELLFDIFSHLIKNNVKKNSLLVTDKKGIEMYSELYDHICNGLAKGRDLSGAQYGQAKTTAFQFYFYGYDTMIEQLPIDRKINIKKERKTKMTLIDMKEQVEQAKVQKSKYEGQIESIMTRLKKEFSLDSIEEAEEKVTALTAEIEKKETELEAGIATLETDYNWN